MRKWNICSIAVILTISIVNNASAQSVTLLRSTYLHHYPSASGIAFSNGKLYIVGDDAQRLLVLDSAHNLIDSVTFFTHTEKRIPYQLKPDLESLSIVSYKGKPYLAAIPSYSTEQRNKLYIFPLADLSQLKMLTNDAPRKHLKNIGIVEPNLEGSTKVNKHLVVSNRANKSQPNNYLIAIPIKKNALKKSKKWKRSELLLSSKNEIIGISGLEYWPETDHLLFTASTEATSNANEDGAIGESYLGYITNYSKKAGKESVAPEKLINLSKELQIGNQKIEGVCIESNKNKTMILHLVADNDDGKSILYKVKLSY